MAKLTYSAITTLDGFVADDTATSTGPTSARRCTPTRRLVAHQEFFDGS
jgi:hypothetical protein